MIALIQRVTQAKVMVNEQIIGEIEQGLLVYLGVEKKDDQISTQRLCHKVLGYRLFADAQGKMNLDVTQVGGQLLVVSQFTLAADTNKGKRPSFSCAATPTQANEYYQYFVAQVAEQGVGIATGEFGADMKVHSINDGPVTFNLSV